MTQAGERRRKARVLLELAAELFLVAVCLYIAPSMRRTFYTADGLRSFRDSFLDWVKDAVRNPATSAVVFLAAGR
jgi:hypothetical protein